MVEEKTYFIFSDIHSFYDELMCALDEAHFDINNSNHCVIVLGDIFDRGTKPLEVYKFLRNIPKERRILIRGNHESLLRDLVRRTFAESYDRSNGTVDTLYYLAGLPSESKHIHNFYIEQFVNAWEYDSPEYNACKNRYEKERDKIWKGTIAKILKWIASDEWVNYYETNNYIFVHSWIPLQQHIDFEKSLSYGHIVKSGPDTYREDWRNATQSEWEDATWGCPWKNAKAKLNQTEKTIVCGHWHTSDFFNNLTKQKKELKDCPIFNSKKYKLIGLDACTAVSHRVNVLVLKESEL